MDLRQRNWSRFISKSADSSFMALKWPKSPAYLTDCATWQSPDITNICELRMVNDKVSRLSSPELGLWLNIIGNLLARIHQNGFPSPPICLPFIDLLASSQVKRLATVQLVCVKCVCVICAYKKLLEPRRSQRCISN